MLYETIVDVELDKCISLSEAFRNSDVSTENMRRYLVQFREMLGILDEHRRIPLKKHPQFVWNGTDSACWYFEEHRIMHCLRDALVRDAADLFNESKHTEARPLLEEALGLTKEMLTKNGTWAKTPFVRAMNEFQPAYLLALAFRTKALYCQNVCAWKTSAPVARMAYQFSELSDMCWKRRAEPDATRQLLVAWHHISAMAGDNFQQRLSHITAAQQLSTAAAVLTDYEDIMEKNRTVYYLQPEPIVCTVLTLEQALQKL